MSEIHSCGCSAHTLPPIQQPIPAQPLEQSLGSLESLFASDCWKGYYDNASDGICQVLKRSGVSANTVRAVMEQYYNLVLNNLSLPEFINASRVTLTPQQRSAQLYLVNTVAKHASRSISDTVKVLNALYDLVYEKKVTTTEWLYPRTHKNRNIATPERTTLWDTIKTPTLIGGTLLLVIGGAVGLYYLNNVAQIAKTVLPQKN